MFKTKKKRRVGASIESQKGAFDKFIKTKEKVNLKI